MTNSLTAVNVAVQNQYLDILDYILSKRALPDVTTADGEIPLLRAVAYENMALVECLIKYGPCVNQNDHVNNTPLVVAVNKIYYGNVSD